MVRLAIVHNFIDILKKIQQVFIYLLSQLHKISSLLDEIIIINLWLSCPFLSFYYPYAI